METWIPLISEYGFPVMITLYLLHRIEKKLDILHHDMQQLVGHMPKPVYADNGPTKLQANR